jgi:hypothetical protein
MAFSKSERSSTCSCCLCVFGNRDDLSHIMGVNLFWRKGTFLFFSLSFGEMKREECVDEERERMRGVWVFILLAAESLRGHISSLS